MKTSKLIGILLVFISLTSCVEDNDFTVPQNLKVGENINLTKLKDSIANKQLELKSISDLKALYISGNDPVKISSNIVVKGYVVSSDETGNYFKEFYIQDKAENPTAGIKVSLNLNNIYNKYNFGREVYIRLKNLYLGETNSGDGVTTIGGKIKMTDTREIESITLNKEKNHFYRSEITETIVPKIVTLVSLNNSSNIGIYVRVEKAFFSGNVKGKAFIDPTEDFDTKRKIETCQGLGFIEAFLETSSFANFANNALPEGAGSLNAVVTRDFGGDFTVLVLNNIDDVNMNDSKCTPLPVSDFPIILLDEDFDTRSGIINILGWTNYREAGSESWESYFNSDISSRGARIGSFKSNDASTIVWLITKGINLDATSEEYLSFITSTSFADRSELEVLISTDWDGNTATIATATWVSLPARIAFNKDNFRTFIKSTFIDLSSYSGIAYVAFKYTGSSDETSDGTYELDNVIIHAK